jgi:hypothetical protein
VGSAYVALVHGPVLNKHGEPVTTAVTGLNIHDIARTVRTYGGAAYYLVTPVPTQRALVARVAAHWSTGAGAAYNPTRKEALEVIRMADTLAGAVDEIAAAEGRAPRVVVTSAREVVGVPPVSYGDLRRALGDDPGPVLLVFGTGWGLTPELLGAADALLPPILGPGGPGAFNHLPVRGAVAIVLDRLLGAREGDGMLD